MSKRFASFYEKTVDEATTLETKDGNIKVCRQAINIENEHFDCNKAGMYDGARTRTQQSAG